MRAVNTARTAPNKSHALRTEAAVRMVAAGEPITTSAKLKAAPYVAMSAEKTESSTAPVAQLSHLRRLS